MIIGMAMAPTQLEEFEIPLHGMRDLGLHIEHIIETACSDG